MVQAYLEPSFEVAKCDFKLQFERHGYFVADGVDHKAGTLVLNLAVGLRDVWGK